MNNYTYEDIQKAKCENNSFREKIITENSGLIWSIVRRFLNRGCEAEDLYQIGTIGLIKAIKNFDTSLGLQFSTYAVPMIMGEIKRHLRDDGIIKVSRSLKELGYKIRVLREEELKKYGHEVTVEELAKKLNVDKEEIVMAIDSEIVPDSLNRIAPSVDRELIDTIEAATNTENEIIEKMAINDAISCLSERDRKIITMRYFDQKTQAQTAKLLGISQVQVSRLEKKILKTMRGLLEEN